MSNHGFQQKPWPFRKLKLVSNGNNTVTWHNIPWNPDWLIGILAYEIIPEHNWVELNPQKIQQITKGPFSVAAQLVYFLSICSFLSESTQEPKLRWSTLKQIFWRIFHKACRRAGEKREKTQSLLLHSWCLSYSSSWTMMIGRLLSFWEGNWSGATY